MKRGGEIPRSAMRQRYRSTGPTAEVVQLVFERDRGKCAACGWTCTGRRGYDWSVHHRRPRSQGGSRRPWINLPANLILLCGHATTACHRDVEQFRLWSEERGYIVRDGIRIPSEVPVTHLAHGGYRVFLDDEGGHRVVGE